MLAFVFDAGTEYRHAVSKGLWLQPSKPGTRAGMQLLSLHVLQHMLCYAIPIGIHMLLSDLLIV